MAYIRPNVMYPVTGNFMAGHHKGVRFTASAVYKKWAQGEEIAISLGNVVEYDDAINYLAKIKSTPKSGAVSGKHHPDQLFWANQSWQKNAAFQTVRDAAKKGFLLRVETDCSIMPCGEFANDSCYLVVPKLIQKNFPSKVAYGILQYTHDTPMHYGKKGRLVTIGNTESSDQDYFSAYKKPPDWEWEP